VNKTHAVLISVAVGASAIAGTLAATKTVHLGRSATVRAKTPSALIAARKQALDRTAVALRQALKQRPPKLPPLPARVPAASGPAGGGFVARAPAQAQRVVYVRPAPIIRHVHRPGGGEGEHESEGGSHDGGGGGGGGFDD
jgi:hypothetical protein